MERKIRERKGKERKSETLEMNKSQPKQNKQTKPSIMHTNNGQRDRHH